ncbi:bifunctional dTDP-4-dehydrorhamnose 3,5-epimerase family protein/NAD(P)-dependent oxidoreductase [Agromyces tropicus]|uniref:dTDP-4-dehydrorhamnose reductase n=1 Tax=Agromyces tropicus TaxID=555371 RepID=A0ABP5G5Z1_9MICO
MSGGNGLRVRPTSIPGLLVLDLPVHADGRGWFKENWQREKMTAQGLPDFGPVQQNVSFNDAVGTTRGVHAEPWDKLVSVATGRVFGAWVDLREGPGFGAVVTEELGPDRAVFVPRGVGNAYQTLEPATAYAYLVNAHWRPDVAYTFLDAGDARTAIPWPIPLEQAVRSERDLAHPRLDDVVPVPARTPVVLGGDGRLGRALRRAMPEAAFLARGDLDVTDAAAVAAHDWSRHSAIVNATAYTDVDGAESAAGREAAWRVNASGPALLAAAARAHGLPLVAVSTDYVFDGSRGDHREDEPVAPLGVYGQSKAAGELAAAGAPEHWILRTSWLVGEGRDFVRTMRELAARGVDPVVVADQVGRLTFADELARAVRHVLEVRPPAGVYHVSNGGAARSWFDVARRVFELAGADPERVSPTSTAEYAAGRPAAPRPARSDFDLAKIRATGFAPRDQDEQLAEYVARLGDDA